MIKFIAPFVLSILNMLYAIFIYLTLQSWFFVHIPGGEQLLSHYFITYLVIIISTMWFFSLSRKNIINHFVWKINLIALFVPLMSMQTGAVYYHYDMFGLFAAILTLLLLVVFMVIEIKRKVC